MEQINNDTYEKFLDNKLSRIYNDSQIFIDTITYIHDGLVSIGYYIFPINDITLPIGISDNSILISTESSNILSPKNFIFKDHDNVLLVTYKLQTFILQVRELFNLSFNYKGETIYYKDLINCNSDFMNLLFLDVNCGEGKTKTICFYPTTSTLRIDFNTIVSRFNYIKQGDICIEELENHFRFIKEAIENIDLLTKNKNIF